MLPRTRNDDEAMPTKTGLDCLRQSVPGFKRIGPVRSALIHVPELGLGAREVAVARDNRQLRPRSSRREAGQARPWLATGSRVRAQVEPRRCGTRLLQSLTPPQRKLCEKTAPIL